jgi:hypothetical protein
VTKTDQYMSVGVMKLKTKPQGSTRLEYTWLFGRMDHLKIETKLIDERFVSVMGKWVFLK